MTDITGADGELQAVTHLADGSTEEVVVHSHVGSDTVPIIAVYSSVGTGPKGASTIAGVLGLQAVLDAIVARIEALE